MNTKLSECSFFFSSGWGFILVEYNLSLIKSRFLASAVGCTVALTAALNPLLLVQAASKHTLYFAISGLV